MTEEVNTEIKNVHSEMLLVGAFYKNPSEYINWGQYMRSKYDFSDEATRFFYNLFEQIYRNHSEEIDEIKISTFVTQDEAVYKKYKKFGGFEILENWMQLADSNDFDKYYSAVKKYSLLREYNRNLIISNIPNHSKFPDMDANDVYRIVRGKVDRINTVISANEESVILNDGMTNAVIDYLSAPQMGLTYPWDTLTEMFRGCRLGKVVLNGFLSNEGKSRNLMMLVAYITLVKGEKFLLLSNEMSEEDLRSCLITTVINNKEFKELHGVDIIKPEKEIVLGQYRDSYGKFIERYEDEDGNFVETKGEFYKRVRLESEEFRNVMKVVNWVDEKSEDLIFFKDVGKDYSDQTLEREYRKHNILYGIKYMGYDTMKGYRTDDWQTVKQTATKLKELMKEINCFMWAVFQLTDDTVFTNIFELSSNNIANAKQIKHIADYMLLGKRVNYGDYGNYEYETVNSWGVGETKRLQLDKKYFVMIVEKNRGGSKMYTPLFEYNLDLNVWDNIGSLKQIAV